MSARQLPTQTVEKVWGRDKLTPPFACRNGQRVGEIWFAPPVEIPNLLVKYLFTSEKLSVQVHPGDVDALPGERGKEECWLVLDAEPGAKLALGFDREVSGEDIKSAARDGTIEQLLSWYQPSAGDFFYLPAGTVHVIGPGLSLVEVQQNSDTTFRLYDYGRPRQLHLDRALAVANKGQHSPKHRRKATELGQTLVDGPYFCVDRVEAEPNQHTLAKYRDGLLALPLAGEVSSVENTARAGPGECLYASGIEALDFSQAEVTLLTRSL